MSEIEVLTSIAEPALRWIEYTRTPAERVGLFLDSPLDQTVRQMLDCIRVIVWHIVNGYCHGLNAPEILAEAARTA